MGWLFSIVIFFVACVSGSGDLMIASALFAIAGAISFKDFK